MIKTPRPTENQKKHIDALWSMSSRNQVDSYMNSLLGEDRIDAIISLNMVIAESMDLIEYDEDEDFVFYLKNI